MVHSYRKWQLSSIGRMKVYNLFDITLGILQVCDCKRGVLGRDHGLLWRNVVGSMTGGIKCGGGVT